CRAAETGLSLALQLDPRAVLDAGGDLHRVALRAPLAARALARRTRRLHDRAHPAALRSRLLQREQPLRRRDDAGAVALGTDDRRGAGCGAGAVAGVACELELHRNRRLHTPERVLERHAHLDLDVVAALPALRLLPSAAAIEEAAEDVTEVEVAEVE